MEWFDLVWEKAVSQGMHETGLDVFPDTCPWQFEQIMNLEFWPQ
ncbi:DUF29 family protein [Candidatus Methylobacter oryzae]|uniref:DUF29 domain-containing protein n=1 Tax=Candidatus Methylobacter oryzae TaxID=2497749 RepID=A0ABY3CD08_9GAMM|nr:DUF29 domain-containing protein [Candidatus Methylobacter oryzae]